MKSKTATQAIPNMEVDVVMSNLSSRQYIFTRRFLENEGHSLTAYRNEKNGKYEISVTLKNHAHLALRSDLMKRGIDVQAYQPGFRSDNAKKIIE